MTGAVSRAIRRRDLALVLALAAIWRVAPWLRLVRNPADAGAPGGTPSVADALYLPPPDLRSFLQSANVSWVGSPLYLLAQSAERQLGSDGFLVLGIQTLVSWLLVLAVYRVGSRWFDHAAGILAAVLAAVSAPLLQVTLVRFPTLAVAAVSLLYASSLIRFAAARTGEGALRLGILGGGLVWLGGVAALWLPATLLWLPTVSRTFRGRPGARVAGWIVLGWLAAIAPLAGRGLLAQDDLVLPFGNAGFDVYEAASTRDVVRAGEDAAAVDPLQRRQRSVERALELAPASSSAEIPRTWTFVRFTARAWGEGAGRQISAFVRRGLAFVGGPVQGPALQIPPGSPLFAKLALLPGDAVWVLAFLGALALASSLRRYQPLYLGLMIPATSGVFTGLTARTQLLAFPFLCLLAGYGLVRWWEGRRAWVTWLLAPLALGAGIVLVWKF